MFAFAGTLNQSVLASAWVGLLLTGAIYTSEPPRLPADYAPAMTSLAAKEFEAASFIEEGTNAATAPSEPAARTDEQAAQLFGLETEPVATGELPETWHHVEAAMARDFAVRNAMQMGPALSPRKD